MFNSMRKNCLVAFFVLVSMQWITVALAVETRLSGHVEAQLRYFPSDPLEPSEFISLPFISLRITEAEDDTVFYSFAIQPEWRYQTQDRKHDFAMVPFARYDVKDQERTNIDMRELYWLYHGEGWEALVGIDRVFWSVAESRHLVNIINQIDFAEDPDEEDQLGQPMVRLTVDVRPILKFLWDAAPKYKKPKIHTKTVLRRNRNIPTGELAFSKMNGMRLSRFLAVSPRTMRVRVEEEVEETDEGGNWGKLSVFLMPGFRTRTFPEHEGRLRGPMPIDEDEEEFVDGASQDRVDFALRYSHTIDRWSIGLHYFHGNSREPYMRGEGILSNLSNVSSNSGDSQAIAQYAHLIPENIRLIPYYELIDQGGIDLQYTGDVWLGKLETIVRDGQGETFTAVVAGFEYTIYQAFDSNLDWGLLMEYLHDDRDDEAPTTTFQDDLFFGTRLSFNDVQSTQILAGYMMDLETDEYSFNLEAERRITNNISAELLLRIFGGAEDPSDRLYGIEKDDYGQLSLSYHF